MTAKILVVDDDQEIGFMMKMMLEHKGYSVFVMERADGVEEKIKEHNVDLIILDMLIAGTKGTDVCRRLKANPDTVALPVIMITALPDIEKICREAGANDFLPKPFEMQSLINKIAEQLKTANAAT